MRRLLVLTLALAAAPASAAEVLVLASAATRVDTDSNRSRQGVEVQNLGPNPIYCEVGTGTAVVTKSRRIPAGEAWGVAARYGVTVYCRAATADQVTGAATIVTEV